MTRLTRIEHARELMDEPGQDPELLEASLDDVAAVNRWLGGRRALLRHLRPLLRAAARSGAGPPSILDAGTGIGDLHAQRRQGQCYQGGKT